MTHDASHSYTYDAENRVTQVDGGATATYVYDGMGSRIEKIVGGTTIEYAHDVAGNVVDELSSTCSYCRTTDYNLVNGQVESIYTNNTTYFVSADHLGSTRLLTNVSGGVVDNMDYLPFGEQIAGASATTHKFTGYERDSESGLDNAQARYNSSPLGRFMSPDPAGSAVADPTNPQSWNLYAYVQNNPLIFIDPSGLECVWDDGSYDGPDDPNTGQITLCNQLGGTWVDHQFFSDFGLSDWSSSPDSGLAAIASALQNGLTLVQTGFGANGWNLQAPSAGWSFIRYLGRVPLQLNITWFIPLGEIPIGIGPALTTAYNPPSRTLCVGGGLGVGTLGKSANFGPLMHGNVSNADSILSGSSLSGGAQLGPLTGYQATVNGSGELGGPSAGTPGISVSATYSKCGKVF